MFGKCNFGVQPNNPPELPSIFLKPTSFQVAKFGETPLIRVPKAQLFASTPIPNSTNTISFETFLTNPKLSNDLHISKKQIPIAKLFEDQLADMTILSQASNSENFTGNIFVLFYIN